jgi:hypothetical protein
MRCPLEPLSRATARIVNATVPRFHPGCAAHSGHREKTLSTARCLQLLAVLLLFGYQPANAGIITIGFETFPDGTPIADSTSITTEFPGLTFTNTTVISAGISLNEFEFPPHSGTNVAFDDGGPISITFSSPISSFSGYFTYDEPLTLAAFDSLDDQVAITTSLFSSNDALFGDPGSSPNQFLQVNFASGISSVIITGDPAGGSFVMDDLTITSAAPEPNFGFLLTVGVPCLCALRRASPHTVSRSEPSPANPQTGSTCLLQASLRRRQRFPAIKT